jgi:hypothetical protein
MSSEIERVFFVTTHEEVQETEPSVQSGAETASAVAFENACAEDDATAELSSDDDVQVA